MPTTLARDGQEAFRDAARAGISAPSPASTPRYHVRLGDIGRTWEVRCTDARGPRARGRHAARARRDVIGTDAATWLALRQGELSGVEAFSQRRLYARGDLDLAVGFEGLFRLPNGRPPLLRIHDVPVGRLELSTLTMGEGPDVLLLHGLGGTKSLVLRHGGRAQPPLPRPRARPARLRRLEQAADARPTTRRGSRGR